MSPRDPNSLVSKTGAGSEQPSTSTSSAETTPSPSSHNELVATASMCHHCFDVLVKELRSTRQNSATASGFKGWTRSRTVSTASSTSSDASSSVAGTSATTTPEFVSHLPEGISAATIECPLFVTWDKQKESSSNNNNNQALTVFELRGCIGTLSPKPLVSSIGEYALISALKDKRFHPVTLQELPMLRVAVSLLVRYEECEDCHDWTVGVHGIIIRWPDVDSYLREYSATYLPEVALEQNWDQRTTLESLIRKAGFQGRITDELLRKIRCTRYQSSKYRVTFDEYLRARGQQQRGDDTGDGLCVNLSSEAVLLRGWTPQGKDSASSDLSSASGNCVIS